MLRDASDLHRLLIANDYSARAAAAHRRTPDIKIVELQRLGEIVVSMPKDLVALETRFLSQIDDAFSFMLDKFTLMPTYEEVLPFFEKGGPRSTIQEDPCLVARANCAYFRREDRHFCGKNATCLA